VTSRHCYFSRPGSKHRRTAPSQRSLIGRLTRSGVPRDLTPHGADLVATPAVRADLATAPPESADLATAPQESADLATTPSQSGSSLIGPLISRRSRDLTPGKERAAALGKDSAPPAGDKASLAHRVRPLFATRKPHLPVGGRLTHFKVQWFALSQSKFIQKWVTGMTIELVDRPPIGPWRPSFDSINGLGEAKAQALEKEVDSLLEKGAIQPAARTPGFYAKVFLVPKKGGKWRPVFNLKPLNAHVQKRAFKMATVRSVAQSIRPGDLAVSLDLKDAYLHVPIAPPHRKFLKFIFRGRTYQFTVLPFGLSSAPRIFTKLTRVVVLHCRALGLRLLVYLDDSLLLAQPRDLVLQHRDLLLALLLDLGFVVNFEKSELAPTQDFTFVGLDWSSRTMAVSLPADKRDTIASAAQSMLSAAKPPSCRRVQQLLGRLNFAAMAIPRAKLRARALQADLNRAYSSAKDVFKPCPLSKQAREDLQWWQAGPPNGLPLVPALPDCTITTDASKAGWGAAWDARRVAGTWNITEASLHINILEMKAVLLALREWAPLLRGRTVALLADNKTVVAYLTKEGGTRSDSLMAVCRQVFGILDRWNVSLRPAYLKGIANTAADALSRGTEVREWCLHPRHFHRIQQLYGRVSWDLFAEEGATLAPQYFSITRGDRQAAAMDALLQDWSRLEGLIYAFPPPQLLQQVLRKVTLERTPLLLVAPQWEDATWITDLRALSRGDPLQLSPPAVTLGPGGPPPPKEGDLKLALWSLWPEP